MIRLLREFRLIPIVLIAAGCLFALKLAGLLLDGGYLLGPRGSKSNNNVVSIPLSASSQVLYPQTVPLDGGAVSASGSKQSWMQEMFGFPNVTGSVASKRTIAKDAMIVTGSANSAKPASKDAPNPDKGGPTPVGKSQIPENKPTAAGGTSIPLDSSRPVSAAERAILERLHERRQELDTRSRALDLREGLLKAAEKRLDERQGELKDLEARVNAGLQKKEEVESSRFKNLATMYENMKAKDAAKIFDRLDIKVLIEMTSQINPRRMSEILAQMSPEAAERLTVELASRASSVDRTSNPTDLPKIEGRPNGT